MFNRDVPDHKITGYRISGQNVTLDIREDNLSDTFRIFNRIPRKYLLKKQKKEKSL